MRAVVLVGGKGTRLRPLTITTPKPLLPIAGQPFLERQLDWLAGHGVTEVVLALGYLPDAFSRHFTGDRYGDLRLSYAVEEHPLGTAGAIRFAALQAGVDDRFIVCNGDVLTTLDLREMLAFHADRRAEVTIHLTRVEDPSALGAVPTAADGEVKAFIEKPPPGESPTDWINAGTYVLEPSVLDRIQPDVMTSIERETFPRMLDEGGRVYATGTDDYWIDIGTPDTYLQAHADVLGGRLGTPPLAGARETAPGVWEQGAPSVGTIDSIEPPALIEDKASVAPDARVAVSAIGPGCVVAEGAVVAGSVLLEGASVGAGARADASILGPGATLEPGAVVRECSVVGAGAHVAAGTTVAGRRV